VQAKRGGDKAKQPLETRTPGPKNMIREVRREGEGAAHSECGSSSLRERWWSMLTMNSHGVEISIAGCVREMVRDPNPMSFFLFFYHAFIVFRYKKLRAALAMERTKPINQHQEQKKPFLLSPPRSLKISRPKPFARCSLRKRKNKENTTLKLLLIYAFFCKGRYRKERLKHPINHASRKPKQIHHGESMLVVLGGVGEGGRVAVGEHVRGKTGFHVCDVLA